MAAAFVFPGQGSQAVGMGKALAEAFPQARAVFDEVDAALGEKLTAIMWEGPAETLTLTENAQPALMAVSLAVDARAGGGGGRRSRTRREVRRRPFARRIFGAGRGRRVHHRRCRAAAAHPRPRHAAGGAGRHRRDGGAARARARRGDARPRPRPRKAQVCEAANDNGGGQVVVSGNTAAVERAVEIAKAKGAKRAMMLPVSAPFHCALMQPAADAMAEALGKTNVKPPVVPVVANVLAAPISDPAEIVQLPGRAGHRHGALARMRGVHGRRGRRHVLRDRRRQGADRPAQAHRRRRDRHGDRHAGRCRGRSRPRAS